ncbi:HPr family phosphocarrier protein [Anaerosporobacter faecicola]|uniref:HPr family phosphocarrier protein n=1 Tax=Anaerosporobacter faecicola TaxID=2718714 RepID=UPI0014390024|nr:HPr family phosphocarrier protein [Anaerosporobacter faecicola]
MVSGKIRVRSSYGLHLRPASLLCQEALKYSCHIMLLTDTKQVNAKSVLGVLGACVKYNMIIEIQCDGEQEEEALQSILSLLDKVFDEECEMEHKNLS